MGSPFVLPAGRQGGNIDRLRFFVGLHKPQHAARTGDVCISINVLRDRVSDFPARDWILDSGAFSEISQHGAYRLPVSDYAARIVRWSRCGRLLAAVAQDYMCEAFILKRTGLTIADHQRLTIERFAELRRLVPPEIYVMPVLQGYEPADYVRHLEQYGELLPAGAWVGVGSVCKRNGNPRAVEAVLAAIVAARPDLRLHGFGIKLTALRSSAVRAALSTADSMAWSFWCRRHGRDANSWREARAYARRVARAA